MRCSYCDAKGHTKRQCLVLKRHFLVFKDASQNVRRDYLALLAENEIGPGTHFRVSNYGNLLVRVTGVAKVSLFSTWSGGRTASSWGYLSLEKMKKITVEQCPNGLDGETSDWIRKFSIAEIFNEHSELTLAPGELMGEDEKAVWISCAEYAKPADMIAAKGKTRASVFAAKNHPYVTKG